MQFDCVELQSLVEKLNGVLAAKFVAGDGGEIAEIHVLSDKSKSPKQLSRDIQSAVCASTGKNIEHRIISIAQIGEEQVKPAGGRLRISGLDISYLGNEVSATVMLADEDVIFSGVAKSLSGSAVRNITVAKACLDAVHKYLNASPFMVSNVQKIPFSSKEVCSVMVSYCEKEEERLLTGSAVIKNDEYYAVIKATLDAINRILPKIRA